MQSFKWFGENLKTFKNSGREKKVVKCYNHWSTLKTFLQCFITCSNYVLSTTGSDSVICAKFQINLMRYGDFPNEQRYQEDSPWKLEVKSWRLWKKTKMYPGQFIVGFFINEDCFGHLCIFEGISWEFSKILQIQGDRSGKMLKTQVNSGKLSLVYSSGSDSVLSSKGSYLMICANWAF